jgi:hypothetical protein
MCDFCFFSVVPQPLVEAIVIALSTFVPGHRHFAHVRTWWGPSSFSSSSSLLNQPNNASSGRGDGFGNGSGGGASEKPASLRVKDIARIKVVGLSKEVLYSLLGFQTVIWFFIFTFDSICCFSKINHIHFFAMYHCLYLYPPSLALSPHFLRSWRSLAPFALWSPSLIWNARPPLCRCMRAGSNRYRLNVS